MVSYVRLDVALHGLKAQSVEEVEQQVRRLLLDSLGAEYESDVDVEVIESA